MKETFLICLWLLQEFEQLISHVVKEAASVLCNGYFAFQCTCYPSRTSCRWLVFPVFLINVTYWHNLVPGLSISTRIFLAILSAFPQQNRKWYFMNIALIKKIDFNFKGHSSGYFIFLMKVVNFNLFQLQIIWLYIFWGGWFSSFAKFSEKLTFLTCANQRVKKFSFSENFANALNKWSLLN